MLNENNRRETPAVLNRCNRNDQRNLAFSYRKCHISNWSEIHPKHVAKTVIVTYVNLKKTEKIPVEYLMDRKEEV